MCCKEEIKITDSAHKLLVFDVPGEDSFIAPCGWKNSLYSNTPTNMMSKSKKTLHTVLSEKQGKKWFQENDNNLHYKRDW